MSELSGFWTTGGAVGHQLPSYTQAHWSIALNVVGACSGAEGVALGYLSELLATDGGANTVNIASGGAIVDGKWYENNASEGINIPSAVGAGNTRIDRIVLRADWSNFQVALYRIEGTDAATPSAPSIIQTEGDVYDIKLYQVLVNTSGEVTITDEREWAGIAVDGLTLEIDEGRVKVSDGGIDSLQIASEAVGESQLEALAITNAKIAEGTIENSKLADPNDILYLSSLDADTVISVENNIRASFIPDIHDGKSIVKITAGITGEVDANNSTTVRVYNVTDGVTIATITIPSGNRVASTTSITNPTLAENDLIRVDCTSAGGVSAGLDVFIKVDKS